MNTTKGRVGYNICRMKNWLIGASLAAANAAFDALVAYMSMHFVAPEAIDNPKVWKGMGIFILFNVAKTMAHYLKTPPKDSRS